MRKHQSFAASAACALLFGAGATVANAQAQGQFIFDLPAERLSQALRDVATRTGRNVIAPDDLLHSREAPPLSGTFTAETALAKLLEGSGLRYRSVNGTLVVEPIPFGSGNIGQGSTTIGSQQIVVTGTHVRGAPPTSPVITLTRKQIDESGATSVEGLMRNLPQNLSAGVAQENFAVPGTGSDITQYGAGINLRGLGQRATLVLIDGKRVAPSDTGSFVDVSLIPITAIDRVEVLTDGASAIYGSDAVGGVVNFILRKDFNGIEPVVQLSTTSEGGGRQLLAGLTAGGRWRGGHALLSYEFRDENPISAKERDFTINLEPDWYLRPREKRNSVYGTLEQEITPNLSLNLSGMYARRKTERTFFDATQIAIAGKARANSLGGTAALQFHPGGSWLAEASASYYRSQTHELESQAGSLFNRSNSLNAFGEIGIKGDGSLVDLPGGALKVALGATARREHFTGLFASSVNIPTIERGSRTVSSAYAELNLPLFSRLNRLPGFEELRITAAGRVEHYERIGSSFNPKLGILWSPLAGIALRSSYGTSFRAPLLSESFGYYNVFLFPVAILYQNPSQATGGVGAALVGYNPNVKPERSRSLSVGIDVTPPPIPQLRFSTNFYKIDFTNRIALPSQEVDLIGAPGFTSIVTLNPSIGSVTSLFSGANQVLDFSGPNFTNGGATPADVVAVVDARLSNTAVTRTSGLDFLLDYGFDLGRNAFDVELNANKVLRFDDKLTGASPWVHTLDTPFNPVGWRARAGLAWRRGALSAATILNYTGSYRDNRSSVVRPVHAFTTVDLSLAFNGRAEQSSWLRRIRLAFDIQNLFDAKPPLLLPDPSSTRGIGYDPVNANGLGRVLSLQLRSTL